MTMGLLYKIFAFTVCVSVIDVNSEMSAASVSETGGDADVEEPQPGDEMPSVFIPILVRNKEHTLPAFFGCLERLNYPRHRISLWIRNDHNVDNSTAMLKEWVAQAKPYYHKIDFKYQQYPQRYLAESGPMDWPDERFEHIVSLRQQALDEARKQEADYYFTIDVDNFLENSDTLLILLHNEKSIIAPVLNSGSMYSNFWGGINENGYYKRTEQYVEILHRNVTGIFKVPMVHSTVLVNLQDSATKDLTYRPTPSYKGDLDDMLIFAHSARDAGIPMYVVNAIYFGQLLVPTAAHESLDDDMEEMLFTKLQTIVERPPIPSSVLISEPERPQDKLGFDEIYMINLKRRPLRRQRMMQSLKWLGIEAKIFDAVDGKALTSDDLISMGIDMLPGYRDPYSERVLTKGEIGCFLSHYKIWQEMVQKNYQEVLVLEDDVRFAQGFRPKLETILLDVALAQIEYDMIYVGRKILYIDQEQFVSGVRDFVKPSYSYWTVSYILTLRGAKKLLAQEPLGRMVPVDEYLPIMFDKHPIEEWAKAFWPRDLKAYSVNPLLAQPTHYIGDNNYFSDTETSNIWEDVHERENGENDAKKGDPDSLEENDDDSPQNHIKTPDLAKDGIGSNLNVTDKEDVKKDAIEKTPVSSAGQEKVMKNEKPNDAVEQSASSASSSSSTRKQDEL